MPYVTVFFDPSKIGQGVIDEFKPWLKTAVASIMSNKEVLSGSATDQDITTHPAAIMVIQHAAHPTDVNVPPLELYIEGGQSKGRSPDMIIAWLGEEIALSGLIPDEYLGDLGESGIFLTFHEVNGFDYIPRRDDLPD